MSTAGAKLLAKLVLEDNPSHFRVIKEMLFTAEELPQYRLIWNHFREYGRFPSEEVLLQGGLILPYEEVQNENFEYFLEQCKTRTVYNTVSSQMSRLTDGLRNRDRESILNTLHGMMRVTSSVHTLDDVTLYADEVQQILEEIDENLRTIGLTTQGVTLGMPDLDSVLGGAQRGDLIVYAGRPNLGKSYILLHAAHMAWNTGASVLFYSMEMTQKQMARRLLALDSTISPNHIQRMLMGFDTRQVIDLAAQEAVNKPPFWFVSGNFKKTVGDLEMTIREHNPSIVFVDSAYLLKPSSKSYNRQRREQVSETIEELKGLATELNVPVVISVQFNRNMQRNTKKEMDLAFLAETDVIGQAASIVLAITQGESPREETTRKLTLLKNREGPVGGNFYMNFVFAPRVDFSSFVPSAAQETPQTNVDWMM